MSNASVPLDQWYRVAKTASWQNLSDVRQVYRSADYVGDFTVFNIKLNNYRLIVGIVYHLQRIYIKYVLTHVEYDKDEWKNDSQF